MQENLPEQEKRIPITDDYMFGYVMRQPGICRKVIGCLLPNVRVSKIAFKDEPEIPDTQKTIYGNLGAHSVRLDVYLDDGKTVFNVEMQTGNKSNLPKRVRYYGGRIDCDQLSKFQDYNELRPTYVIFICTFDPFGKDEYHYSFENRCLEVSDLKLGDESYKLFFNVKGHKGKISPELKALLDYFHYPNKILKNEETDLVRELDSFVDLANHNDDWRRGYMTYMQAQLDARNEGIREGRNEGILSTLSALVKKGLLSVKDASSQAGMSEQEFSQKMAMQIE